MKKTFLVRGAFLLVISLMIGARALAAPSACSSVSAERLIKTTACNQWATLGSNIYNTNSSNVGIGTTNPNTKLDVNGEISSYGSIYQNSGTYGLTLDGNALLFIHDQAGDTASISIDPSDNLLLRALVGSVRLSGGPIGVGLNVTNSNNVGIGAINPLYKLDVNGSIHGTNYLSSDGTIGISKIINVRNSNNSGACAITVKNGLITATTCQ